MSKAKHIIKHNPPEKKTVTYSNISEELISESEITNLQRNLEFLVETDEIQDKDPKFTRNVKSILDFLHEKANSLLGGLSEIQSIEVLKAVQLVELRKDDKLFQQGDAANGYYFILRGKIAIHKLTTTQAVVLERYTDSDANGSDRSNFGPQVALLTAGEGFGDLTFGSSADSRRTATAVCGDSNSSDNDSDSDTEKTTLLFVPLAAYMKYLVPLSANRIEVNMRFLQLQKLPLFEQWPSLQLKRLAAGLRPRSVFRPGRCLAKIGDKAEYVYFIVTGEVKVSLSRDASANAKAFNSAQKLKMGKRDEMHQQLLREGQNMGVQLSRRVNVAVLGSGEIYGLCEMVHKLSQSYRTAICMTAVETWVIKTADLYDIVFSNAQIQEVFERIVENRMKWEQLALQYTCKFPQFQIPIRGKMNKLCNYSTLQPILTCTERKHIIELTEKCQRVLYNARTIFRYGMDFSKRGYLSEALTAFTAAAEECLVGTRLARELGKANQLYSISELERQLKDQIAAHALEVRNATAIGKRPPTPDGRVVSTLNWIAHATESAHGSSVGSLSQMSLFPKEQRPTSERRHPEPVRPDRERPNSVPNSKYPGRVSPAGHNSPGVTPRKQFAPADILVPHPPAIPTQNTASSRRSSIKPASSRRSSRRSSIKTPTSHHDTLSLFPSVSPTTKKDVAQISQKPQLFIKPTNQEEASSIGPHISGKKNEARRSSFSAAQTPRSALSPRYAESKQMKFQQNLMLAVNFQFNAKDPDHLFSSKKHDIFKQSKKAEAKYKSECLTKADKILSMFENMAHN